MKITINTLGTRGDVQPYVALGQGLKRSGHSVRILTHRIFQSFVEEHGLEVYPLDLDPKQVLVNQAVSEIGDNLIRMNRWLERNLRPALEEIFAVTLEANRGSELILNTGLSFAGWHVAERLGTPAIATYLWPAIPSRSIPPILGRRPPSWLPFKGAYNYWSAKLSNQMFFAALKSAVDRCRRDILGLDPLTWRDYWQLDSPGSQVPVIFGYSPIVVPKPPDWTDFQQVSGYWYLESKKDFQSESSLLDFLAAGPPPVFFGFGSMVDHERKQVVRAVVDSLSETHLRGVLQRGWSGLRSEDLPDSIFSVEAIPHDWLFPRMAAVVHHGGAGTTAAGLRAGVPTIIVPSFGDQFFWGWRIRQMGVGPEPIPRTQLTADRLIAAIREAVGTEAVRRHADRLGQQIRSENGVTAAVQMIERFASEGHL